MPRLYRLSGRVIPLTLFAVVVPALFDPPPPLTADEQGSPHRDGSKEVVVLRTPHAGIQPQVVIDKGTIHLIYFKGDPAHGDLFYVQATWPKLEFSHPVRVNSEPGSAIAIGNVRGAHLAVGAKGRVHVAWMGSDRARPRATGGATPMLYARLNDKGTAFEPQRNVVQEAIGLDGGGSIAASANKVCVFWHAPTPGKEGEEHRRVWMAVSEDEGQTFGKERPISPDGTGVCGCCGMRAFADAGVLQVLYRSASDSGRSRDSYLLFGTLGGRVDKAIRLQEWKVNTCPMSTFAGAAAGDQTVAAWETNGAVSFALISRKGEVSDPIVPPGRKGKRKHPAVAANATHVLLAWTEGMGWNRGGSVAWQLFRRDGTPTAERGSAPGVPVWSLVTAAALPDGKFLVIF